MTAEVRHLDQPRQTQVVLLVGLVLLLTLVRVPFFFTHHIQEDAYIHFQHARSLAQTGVFGFNPGERVSGSTSPLYAVLIAPIFALFSDDAVTVILLLNGIIFNIAALFIAWALCPHETFRRRVIVAVFISLTPTGLVTSYSGMESSLLLFLFAVLLYGYVNERAAKFSLIALVLVPWTRIDSTAFIALYLPTLFLKNRRRAIVEGVVFAASVLAMFAAFQAYFGTYLPQTILAKAVTYNIEGATLADRIGNTIEALARVLMPVNSKYLYSVELLWAALLAALVVLAARRYWGKPERNLILLMAAYAILGPASYGVSAANLFPWYIFPASVFALALLGRLLVDVIAQTRQARVWSGLVVLALIAGIGAQAVVSFSAGAQDYLYRRSVGLWLRDHSAAGDSVMLEPIGYIGYFSRLYIHDEVGLVSPLMTQYRKTEGNHWWWSYIRDNQPTFVVERQHIFDEETFFGPIPPEDYDAFMKDYELVQSFQYDPANYFDNALLRKIAELGAAADYYVFQRKATIKTEGES